MLGIYLVIYFCANNFIIIVINSPLSGAFPSDVNTLSKVASVNDAGDCAHNLELQIMYEAFHET